MSDVIAILCSDIHLSHKPPILRSTEPDWYAAMQRPLDEIIYLVHQYDVPVICAGDVFDRWSSPPELINWAIRYLPEMYAIPGQHDLPYHKLEDVHKSAYWTLVEAGVIHNLELRAVKTYDRLSISGFPWSVDIEPLALNFPKHVHLAVVHSYIWKEGFGYPGADETKRTIRYSQRLKGYQAAVFGDNHHGFTATMPTDSGVCQVINTGTLMRRKTDELKYTPTVGLLMGNGRIKTHSLDVSDDMYLVDDLPSSDRTDLILLDDFVDGLKSADVDSLDFRQAVIQYMDRENIGKHVRELVLSTME